MKLEITQHERTCRDQTKRVDMACGGKNNGFRKKNNYQNCPVTTVDIDLALENISYPEW